MAVALAAEKLCQSRKRKPLTCLAHVLEPKLCHLLRQKELSEAAKSGLRVEFFSLYENGARSLLRSHPPFAQGRSPHVLLVGLDRLGESVLVNLARHWETIASDDGRQLRVTAIDPTARLRIASLLARYPWLGSQCALEARDFDLSAGLANWDAAMPCPVGDFTAAYLCLPGDEESTLAALWLMRHLQGKGTELPVVVCFNQETGLASLLRDMARSRPGFASLRVFTLLNHACDLEVLLEGTHERLARAVHANYLHQRRRSQLTQDKDPSFVDWEKLPEVFRESSRQQAEHIVTELATIDCAVTPLADHGAERFGFSAEEIESLAEQEHERWMEERLKAGWTLGPKSAGPTCSPYLIPYGDLPEEVKDFDRDAVRRIPSLLAIAGLQISRLAPGRREFP